MPPADSGGGPIGAPTSTVCWSAGMESSKPVGRSFRWSEPVALLRLGAPAGGAVVRIATAGLRGAPLDYLHGVYAGRALPPELIEGRRR